MKKTTLTLVLPLMLLGGCANESGARMGLLSATAPVIAVLADDLFTGEATGYMDRTGKIEIQSQLNPELKCIGEFRYTGSKTGTARVRCNDGNDALMEFTGLSALSGYGFGNSSRGAASFTFGLTPEQASQYLRVPKGKKLETQKAKPPRLADV